MDAKVNYILVGLFTVLLSIALVILILWLSVAPTTAKNYQTYLAYMRESVAGLNANAAVKYHGVDVGKVKAIELDKANPERVRLTLDIKQGVPIKEDTIAVLTSNGLVGTAYIELTGGTKEAPPLKAKEGQRYPVIDTGPSLLVRLDTILTGLLAELTGAAHDINRIAQSVDTGLIEQSQQALAETLKNTEQLTAYLTSQASRLEAGINDLITILEQGAKASKQLPILVKQATHSLRPIGEAATELEVLLQEGQQGFRLFTQSTLPHVNQLLTNLDQVVRNLERFSEQVEQNPRALLFGPSPLQLGPGE